MKHQNRRSFILSSVAVSGVLFSSSALGTMSATNLETTPATIEKKSNKRTLGKGKHQLEINHGMGIGCMGMSWHRTFIPERKSMITLIQNAYDMGVNFFDTAEAYGPWRNEELIGEAIKPFRKNILLCTKFGFNITDGKLNGLNSKPSHIKEVVEQSLKRLKTDYIDLLYQHRVDPTVPMEEVAGTVAELIKEGKVKHWGLSEADPVSIRKAHAVHPLTALQSEFSLMTKEPLNDVIPVCEALGIGFVPWSPLGRAYLTGYINERTKYDVKNDNRPSLSRYQPESVIANWKLLDIITEFGNKRGLTAAQVSLAWLMAQKPWVVPIPGTTKQAHLQENLWASEFVFTSDELKNFTDEIMKVRVTPK